MPEHSDGVQEPPAVWKGDVRIGSVEHDRRMGICSAGRWISALISFFARELKLWLRRVWSDVTRRLRVTTLGQSEEYNLMLWLDYNICMYLINVKYSTYSTVPVIQEVDAQLYQVGAIPT